MTENPTDHNDETPTSDASSAVEAFVRMIEDPEFASALAGDPDAALADYDVTDELREALVADATSLDEQDDVAGFVMVGMGQKDAFMTPGILSQHGFSVRVEGSASIGASVVVEPYEGIIGRPRHQG